MVLSTVASGAAIDPVGVPTSSAPGVIDTEFAWERRVVDLVHETAHQLLPELVSCCFVPLGCSPEILCGNRSISLRLLFERLAGAARNAYVAIEVHRGPLPAGTRYVAIIPVEWRKRIVGRMHLISDRPPDITVLAQIASRVALGAERVAPQGPENRSENRQDLDDQEQEALFDALIAEPDRQPTVRHLLRRVADELGGAVVVQTTRFVVLDVVGDVERVALDGTKYRDRETLARIGAPDRVTVFPGRRSETLRAVTPVHSELGAPYYLVAEVDEDSPRARAVLKHAAGILTWLLRMEQDSHEDVMQRRAAIVADMFRGDALTGLSVRAAVLGHDLYKPHRAYVFTWEETAFRGGDAELLRLARVIQADLRGSNPESPEALIAISGSQVIALAPDSDGSVPEVWARGAVAAAREADLPVVCGFGPRCHNPEELALGLQDAGRAAEVIRYTNRPGPVISHADLGVFGLLFSDADRSRLDQFVLRWLGPLIDHDRMNNGALMITLRSLLNHSTMVDAANALFIHISTLKYRYKQIEKILHADMHDPEVIFNLQLALKLHVLVRGDLLTRRYG